MAVPAILIRVLAHVAVRAASHAVQSRLVRGGSLRAVRGGLLGSGPLPFVRSRVASTSLAGSLIRLRGAEALKNTLTVAIQWEVADLVASEIVERQIAAADRLAVETEAALAASPEARAALASALAWVYLEEAVRLSPVISGEYVSDWLHAAADLERETEARGGAEPISPGGASSEAALAALASRVAGRPLAAGVLVVPPYNAAARERMLARARRLDEAIEAFRRGDRRGVVAARRIAAWTARAEALRARALLLENPRAEIVGRDWIGPVVLVPPSTPPGSARLVETDDATYVEVSNRVRHFALVEAETGAAARAAAAAERAIPDGASAYVRRIGRSRAAIGVRR